MAESDARAPMDPHHYLPGIPTEEQLARRVSWGQLSGNVEDQFENLHRMVHVPEGVFDPRANLAPMTITDATTATAATATCTIMQEEAASTTAEEDRRVQTPQADATSYPVPPQNPLPRGLRGPSIIVDHHLLTRSVTTGGNIATPLSSSPIVGGDTSRNNDTCPTRNHQGFLAGPTAERQLDRSSSSSSSPSHQEEQQQQQLGHRTITTSVGRCAAGPEEDTTTSTIGRTTIYVDITSDDDDDSASSVPQPEEEASSSPIITTTASSPNHQTESPLRYHSPHEAE